MNALDMKIYKLGGHVLSNYRKYVKGNENVSKPLARRKLTRNIMMSLKLSDNVDGKGTELYAYGNLFIYVRGDKIKKVKNTFRDSSWFYKNMKLYDELNESLEIKKYTYLQQLRQQDSFERRELLSDC